MADTRIESLRTLVGSAESPTAANPTGDYNIAFGQTAPQQDFTNMTVDQVLDWQTNYVNQGSESSAAGRYQIIKPTLEGLKTNMGLTGQETFTPELQDQMFLQLAEGRGLNEYLAGNLPQDQFINNLSQEWAGIPNTTGVSTYEGVGSNRATVSPQEVITALNASGIPTPVENYNRDFTTSLADAKTRQLQAKNESLGISAPTAGDIRTAAGINLMNQAQLQQWLEDKPWMWDYENDTFGGELKNFTAALASGSIRVTTELLKIGPNVRIALNRYEDTPESRNIIDSLTPWVEYMDAVEADWASNVNRIDEASIAADMKPFVEAAGRHIENGNYWGAISNTLAGAFSAAVQNPVAAAEMFAESVPQMIATAASMGLTTVSLASDYSREFYEDFTEANGRPPQGTELHVINAMSLAAAIPDTMSDKLLMKGFPVFSKGMAALADTIGLPAKSFARVTAKLAGTAIGQPAQEMFAGAATELASQYAAVQDTARLDAEEIATQAALEATAVIPFLGGRAIKTVAGGATAKLAERAIDTAERSRAAFDEAQETFVQGMAQVQQTVDPNATSVQDANPLQALGTFVTQTINQQVEAGATPVQIYNQGQQILSEAIDYMQTLPESDIDAEDFAQVSVLADMVKAYGVMAQSGHKAVTIEEAGSAVARILEAAKTVQQKDVETVLHSMKTSYNVPLEAAESLLRSKKLSPQQSQEVKAYVERYKAMQEVTGEVSKGTDFKYKGYTVRAANIIGYLTDGNLEAARAEYKRLQNFGKYQALKVKAFQDVKSWQKGDAIPSSITDVTFNPNDGSIDTFRVANDMGFSPEKPFFVPEKNGQKGLETMIRQVGAEAKIIRSTLQSLKRESERILGKEETQETKPVQEEQKPVEQEAQTEEQIEQQPEEPAVKEEKYRLFGEVYANADQRGAIDKIGAWIADTKSTITTFVLEGRGGTGKTTTVQKIIENSGLKTSEVAYTATTNKAKAVLAKATGQDASTIWTLLGLRPADQKDILDGKSDGSVQDSGETELNGIKLIIIDEASMLTEELIEKIEKATNEYGIKVLYMGDSAQLPPVRVTAKAKAGVQGVEFGPDANSPVFNEEQYPNRVKLLKTQRQVGDSPILKLTKVFTDVLDRLPWLRKALATKRILIQKADRKTNFDTKTNSGVIFSNNSNEMLKAFVKDYIANPLNTRIVTAFNEANFNQRTSVANLNRSIFKKIYGDTREYGQFAEGDVIMAYNSVKLNEDEPELNIWNSSEYQILNASEVTYIEFDTLKIPVQTVTLKDLISGVEIKVQVPAVTDTTDLGGATQLKYAIGKVFSEAKKTKSAKDYEAFVSKNAAVRKLANIEFEYAYALTAWKSQGSTYRNVYVMENGFNDRLKYTDTSGKTGYQAMYVALSRPTDKLVIHSQDLNAESEQVAVADIDFSAQETNVNAKPASKTTTSQPEVTQEAEAQELETPEEAPLGEERAEPEQQTVQEQLQETVEVEVTEQAEPISQLVEQLQMDLTNVETFNLGETLVKTVKNVADTGKSLIDLVIPRGIKDLSELDVEDTDSSTNAYDINSNVSILRKIPEMMDQYYEGKILQNLNEDQKATMDRVFKFNTRFEAMVKRILPAVQFDKFNPKFKAGNKELNQYDLNPFLYFINKEDGKKGELDPNVATAMAVAALNWIGAEGKGTLVNSDAYINRLTNRDPKGPVNLSKAKQLRYAGIPQAQAFESLGKEFLRSLGLKGNPNAEGDAQAQMEMAAGAVIFQAMEEMDLVETVAVNRKVFGPVDKGQAPTANFIRVKGIENNPAKPTKAAAEIIKEYRKTNEVSLRDVLSEVFGVSTVQKFPRFKPSKLSKAATYLRTNIQLPKQVIKDINYAQSVPWNFKPSMIQFLENADRDFLRKLYKSNTKQVYVYDLDTVSFDLRENVIANNQAIDDEIDGLLEFYQIAKAEGFEDFYFNYATWSNSRHGITNTDFNPQNSKLVRHFIQTDKFTVELDIKNKDHIVALNYAIGLALGIDVDKLEPKSVERDFVKERETQGFKDAIAALRLLDENPNDKKAKTTLEAYITTKSSPAHALDALKARQAFEDARDSGSQKFTIDLANEADAVTSGVIIGLLTAGIDTEQIREKLQAGGIFFDETIYSYGQWKSDPNHKDNYEQLSGIWEQELDKVLNRFVGENYRSNFEKIIRPFVGSIRRAMAKDPVMVTNYGAGLASTRKAFMNTMEAQLYERMVGPKAAETIELLNEFVDWINQSSTKKLPKIPKNFDGAKEPLNPQIAKDYLSFINNTYGESLELALENYSPDFQVYQKTINNAVNAVAWVFQAKFESMKKKWAYKNKVPVNKLSKTDLIEIMESDEMAPFLPMFRFPDSESKLEGGMFIKTEKSYSEDPADQLQAKFINSKTGNKGYKNRSFNIAKREYVDPGVSGLVRMIQSLDDKAIRALLGSENVLSAFDAAYSDLANMSRHAQKYTKAVLKSTRDFSITESVLETFQEAIEAGDLSELDSYFDNIIGSNNITITSDENLFDELKNGAPFSSIIQSIYADLENQLKWEKDSKPKLHNAIRYAEHAPTSNSTVTVNPNTKRQSIDSINADLTEDFLRSAVNEEQVSEEDFEADQEFDLTVDSVASVFDHLAGVGRAKASASHRAKLSELIDSTIAPMIARLGPFRLLMRDSAQVAQGWLDKKQVFIENNISTLKTNLEMSAQEIYAHELSHAITKAGIADPKNEPIRREMERLQQDAKDHLNRKYNGEGWKVFLKTDAQGNILYQISEETEIQTAKDQFDYIFNDTDLVRVNYTDADGNVRTTKQRRALMEFTAIGLTNEKLNNALADMTFTKNKVDTNPTFFGKLESLFLRLIDSIARKINRTTDLTGDQALLNMVQEMNRAHTKKAYASKVIMDQIDRGNTQVRKRWIKHVLQPLGKFNYEMHIKAASRTGKLATAIQVATIGAGTILPVHNVPGVDPDAFTQAIESVRRRLHRAKRGLAYEVLRQIVPSQDPYMKRLEWLHLESKNIVDTARERAIDAIRSDIQNSFKTELSEKEWESLSIGLLQTDFSMLFDKLTPTNANQLVRYLTNASNARTDEINQISAQLKAQFGKNGNYFVNQARSLGQFMAIGKARVKDQGMNAYVIANGTLVDNFNPVAEPGTAEALIDRLATLYSMDYLTTGTQQMVADVIQREYQEDPRDNGIETMFSLHKAFKVESLKNNFNNNKAMATKGYIKQVFSPHIEVRVGYASDAPAMQKENFVQVGEVGFDSSDTETQPRFLFVNDAAGLGRFDKAILSLTSEQVAGSSIRNGRLGMQNPDDYMNNSAKIRQIKESNKLAVARQFASDNHLDTDPALMIPSVNEDGNIHDYRYMMTHDNKITLLEQKLDSADVLARMFASIKDKTETKRVNHKAVDAMHEDFVRNFSRFPSDFTKIDPQSGDPEVREMYMMMPKETRLYAAQKFGGDIWVRTEGLDIIFGKRRFHLAKNSYPKMLRIAEEIWKEIVSFAKTNIVIKNPAVITGNVLSNTFVGFLRGVPIEEMVRGQLRGIRLLNNYQKDLTQIERLNARYDALKATGQDTTDVRAKISIIKNRLDNSELKPLIDAGLFQTIVEDVNVKPEESGYIEEYFNKFKIKMPLFLQKEDVAGKIKAGADFAFITRDTGAFKLLMKGTQYSDFVARYAMFNYMTKEAPQGKRLSKDNALRVILELFINYELPTNKYLQYADDMGVLVFLKYPTRIIRALYSALKDNPLNALGLVMMEAAIDPETPLDASFVSAWDPMRSADMTLTSASTVPISNWIP